MLLGLLRRFKTVEFKAPVKGKAVSLAAVPDPVFAAKILGDGLAIEPREGIIYAPVAGVVDCLFPTKHAIGIQTREGLKVIIHIGIDTVNLKGDGFENLVRVNQAVKAGDQLMKFDIALLQEKAKSAIIPVIITNMDRVAAIRFQYGEVDVHHTMMRVRLK